MKNNIQTTTSNVTYLFPYKLIIFETAFLVYMRVFVMDGLTLFFMSWMN